MDKKIRETFAPVKCKTQIEFDKRMSAINNQQSIENHLYLDHLLELNKQKTLIETQMQGLKVQLNTIKAQRLEIEQKRKDINRLFHQLKHELIMLNPRDGYAKTTTE